LRASRGYVWSICATIATVLIWSFQAKAMAQPSPPPPAVSLYGDPGAPDISGLWLGTITSTPQTSPKTREGIGADGRPPTYWAPWPLPYTPKYQKIFEDRATAAKAGRQPGDNGAKCLPFGLPQMLVSKVYPDEIIQTPGAVTILVNSTFPIVIWTDRRGHPKDLTPSYNGHSIGHWVDDTLFVDTVGIIGSTALDVFRNPHSDKLHIRWNIQRVAKDVLHVHVTLYDDEAFTEPVTTTNIWHRMSGPGWDILDDGSCFENNVGAMPTAPIPGFSTF